MSYKVSSRKDFSLFYGAGLNLELSTAPLKLSPAPKKTKPSAAFGQTGTAPTAHRSLLVADLLHELVETRPRDTVRHVLGDRVGFFSV